MTNPEALTLLASAKTITFAGRTTNGGPLIRTVNHVVIDGGVYFHGAPVGEKMEALEGDVVGQVEETLAIIPSYFTDPERACPATTLYESVQIHGTLSEVHDTPMKARVLATLMQKLQPEGGHVPITAEHPLYAKAIAGLLVAGVRPSRIDGKAKVMQNKSPRDRAKVIDALWSRGDVSDLRTIERVVHHNAYDAAPPLLAGPCGTRLVLCPTGRHAQRVAELVEDAYWNQSQGEAGVGISREAIARAHLGATAWLVLEDASNDVVASARAISDGAKRAWIYDVYVAEEERRRGLARFLLTRLLDHPKVRGTLDVRLGTRDAQSLYAGLGFADASLSRRPYPVTEMVLRRS